RVNHMEISAHSTTGKASRPNIQIKNAPHPFGDRGCYSFAARVLMWCRTLQCQRLYAKNPLDRAAEAIPCPVGFCPHGIAAKLSRCFNPR
ncbi:hypothetical protein, partial [Phormidium sp. CCY1219]|uniref:hypothetical protein n=1 Tax=Phormidium sp. CCY1219 TaxID=2886104 RepID=UPI002D1F3309